MPKNTSSDNRPNFDPSYAKGGRKFAPKKAAPKSGSRSPGHRGYKEETEAPRKERWSRDERVAQGRSPHRAERPGREERSGRDERPRYDRDDRAPRRDDRGSDRAPRSYDRDDRAPRRDDRGGDRAPRSFDRNDRAPRSFDRNDRAPRSFDRDDRAPRRDDRGGDRAPRRDDRSSDRAPRSFDRNDRAPRRDDRGSDRAPRSFDRDDRAPRRDDRGGAPRSFDRNDRAPRRDDRGSDRAPRSFDRDDRAPRRDDRAERPRFDRAPRRDDRSDRPRFDRDDRGPRRDERAPRAAHGGAPARGESKFYPTREEKNFTPQDDVVLERLEAQAIQAQDVDGVTFGDLGLGGNIVRTLAELGAASPFPIQAATIPVVLEGRDVLGRGRTGSGKTIAFGAPTVERLMENNGGKNRKMGRKPRALILAPTRELALQIDRTVQPIARSVGLFTTQIYGGVPQFRQVSALQRGVDIIIGTPGRIEDLIDQGKLDLSEVVITVLDEADHMCDLGFLEPVQRILRHTADQGQKLLFSATLDKGVATLVDEFLVNPAVHEVAGEDQASSTIEHRVLLIENSDKRQIVAQLSDREGKTLVFSRTRAFAEDLTDFLEDRGIRAVSLHGDLNQARRTRNLHQLTSGKVNVLVATDVAARGIHVDDIDLVIQADAPDEYKTYLHRAGRTGRAGKLGTVVTLIPRNRQRRMDELLERAEIEAEFERVTPGDEVLQKLQNA